MRLGLVSGSVRVRATVRIRGSVRVRVRTRDGVRVERLRARVRVSIRAKAWVKVKRVRVRVRHLVIWRAKTNRAITDANCNAVIRIASGLQCLHYRRDPRCGSGIAANHQDMSNSVKS